MARIKLKSILEKDGAARHALDDLCKSLKEKLCVKDSRDNVLYGQEFDKPEKSLKITYHDDDLGLVQGGKNIVPLTSRFINALLAKEEEKKMVGEEVLVLYREINLIYNFTEQLAHYIDPPSIANLALEEADRILKTRGGSVILWERPKKPPELLAEIGDTWKLLNDTNGAEKLSLLMQRESPEILTRSVLLFISPDYKSEWGSLIYAPLKVKNQVLGVIYLVGDHRRTFTAADLKLLTTIALQTASAIESSLMYERQMKEAREREQTMKQVQEMTSRFVPFEFLKSLGRNTLMETQLGDHAENVVTVVFMDIRKFTSLAEGMTPEQNFKFVNSFNARIGPVIKENKGFINQYLGDGIMAIFPDDPTHALKASIAMLQVLQKYNDHRLERGRKSIRIGIGMHTGSLVMGITGDDKRWEATTISDTVNTASRIESLTKFYKCNIILSQQSLERIKDIDGFNIRSLGRVQVQGKQEAIRIYECFDGDLEQMISSKRDSISHFNHGINSYEKKSFRESTKAFSQVLVGNPDDETAQCFLGRISNLLTSELTREWNGIDKMTQK